MNEQQNNTSEEEYVTFIGKNAEKYLPTFQKFHVNGVDQFSVTWHWPAFLFPFFWLLYRKLYLWAILSLVWSVTIRPSPFGFLLPLVGFPLPLVEFLPPMVGFLLPIVGSLLPMLAFGLTANYLYYKHMKKKLSALQQLQALSDTQRAAKIVHAGGVNSVFVIVIMLGIAAFWGWVIYVNLSVGIQVDKRSRTSAEMRAIGTALGNYQVNEGYYPIQQPEGGLSNELLTGKYSYYTGSIQDAWHTPFRYVSDGASYTLTSYGKDAKVGNPTKGDWDEDIIYVNGLFIAPDELRSR